MGGEDFRTVYIAGDIDAEAVECDKEEHEENGTRLTGFVGIIRGAIMCIQGRHDGQANNASGLRIG